jgi:hypothetical protein
MFLFNVSCAGDLAYYFFQMMWMVYKQLAAMKVVPQIAAGARAHGLLGWQGLRKLSGHTYVANLVEPGCAVSQDNRWVCAHIAEQAESDLRTYRDVHVGVSTALQPGTRECVDGIATRRHAGAAIVLTVHRWCDR